MENIKSQLKSNPRREKVEEKVKAQEKAPNLIETQGGQASSGENEEKVPKSVFNRFKTKEIKRF